MARVSSIATAAIFQRGANLLGGRDLRIGEAEGELVADGSDERDAVIFVKRYLSLGFGTQPNRSAAIQMG